MKEALDTFKSGSTIENQDCITGKHRCRVLVQFSCQWLTHCETLLGKYFLFSSLLLVEKLRLEKRRYLPNKVAQ